MGHDDQEPEHDVSAMGHDSCGPRHSPHFRHSPQGNLLTVDGNSALHVGGDAPMGHDYLVVGHDDQEPGRDSRKRGFTLVEVLVSAFITLLMIIAAVGVMRHGQKVQALDQQGNRARQHMVTELEKIEYAPAQYDTIPITVKFDSIVLDNRGTAALTDDLKAGVMLTVDTSTLMLDTIAIPRKLITMRASWTSLDGTDTLTLERWICKVLL